MTYEIQIGQSFDMSKGKLAPKTVIIISEDQKLIIDTFASTKKDEDLNTIYILNEVEFYIVPVLFSDND